MAEFAGHAFTSADQAPIEQNTRADSVGNRNGEHVGSVDEFAEPALSEQAGVGRVLHHDGGLERLLEFTFEIDLGPGSVGSKHQFVGGLVDTAGHAHAHAFDEAAPKGGFQRRGGFGDGCDGGPSAAPGRASGGKLDGFAAQDFAVDVDDAEVGPGGAEIDGEGDMLVIEGDKGGPAPARKMAEYSRRHPGFFDELAKDERNSAGLEASQAGQVGAAYRLAHVNGLQDDVPIDRARCLAGGDSAIWPGWLGVHALLVRMAGSPRITVCESIC